MSHLTRHTVEEMRAAGFTYPAYEHFVNIGMLYACGEDEYLIGGSCAAAFTQQDVTAAESGLWLPGAEQLLEWLKYTDFTAEISMNEDGYFVVQATDQINGAVYTGGGLRLVDALAKVIGKICKSKKRSYVPREPLRIPIVEE